MTKIQTQRQASTKALSTFTGFLNFDPLLYKDSPLTLGLLPEDITLLLNVISERTVKDEHLINRLTCYLEQVTYAHSHPGIIDPSLFTPKTWGKATPLRYEYGKQYHPYINPKHLREWLDSGIDPTLILANLESFYHENLGKKFTCNFAVNSPGWAGYAVDLLTGLTDLTVSTHFKPDTPYTDGKGRSAKYLCQSKNAGKSIDAVLHNTLNPNYWQEVIESDCPIIITEGTKKALCGLSHGLPTIALLGTWMGIDKVDKGVYELKESLKLFMQGNRVIYLAFDSDITHKQSVYDAMLVTANAIQQVPNFTGQVKVVTWKYSQLTKGMDDFIKHEGIDAFRALLENAYTLEAFIANHKAKATLELEQAIIDLNNDSNLYSKAIKKGRIKSDFGLSPNDILELSHYQQVTESNKVEFPDILSIDDILFGDLVQDHKYLLPSYLVVGGVSLIYGKSGDGKSWYMYRQAMALADGSKFIDQIPTDKYRTLIIQMDETSPDVKLRLQMLGFSAWDYRDYVKVRTKEKPWYADPPGLKWLEKTIVEGSFDCVMIDNLKKVVSPSVNLFTHDVQHQVIDPLSNIGARHNCSILMLHHTNGKDEMYGYKGLNDSCSIVHHLKKVNERICLENIKQKNASTSPKTYFDYDYSDNVRIVNVTTQSNSNSESTTDTNYSDSKLRKVSEKDRLIEKIKTINGTCCFDKDSNSIVTCSDEFTSKLLVKLGFSENVVKKTIADLKGDNKIKEVGMEGNTKVYKATESI